MKRMGRTLIASAAVAGLVAGAIASPAVAAKQRSNPLKGEGVGMKIVANVAYDGGTDMEFFTQKGRDYALAGSAPGVGGAKAGAFHVIDITTPSKPKEVATLKCSFYQADIQISHDQKTAMIAADAAGGPDACLGVGKTGFMTIDISNVLKPKPVGYAEVPKGAHNVTAHPTKPYVYVSDSNISAPGEIQIWSIKNPAKPELVNTIPSLPTPPHDISFNKDGTRAVTAAISHIDIFDTTDPENPSLTWTGQCPGCSITHDAKFTPDGNSVIVGDEGGGGGGYPCPGGALYFYDYSSQVAPVLTGIYEPNEVALARDDQGGLGGCTSHVFDIADDGKKVAISWYTAGTRLLDVSNMVGVAFGENNTGGVAELGWFQPAGGNSWSSKFYKGEKYVFSNDIERGFDVLQVTGK